MINQTKEKQGDEGETILVVEDEDWILDLVTEVLTKQGYKVLRARNGDEGLQFANDPTIKIDLLFTDIVMPKMDGVELAEHFAKLRPDMKVIFTSGYTQHASFHQTLSEHGMGFLPKPYRLEKLIGTVGEVLHPPMKSS